MYNGWKVRVNWLYKERLAQHDKQHVPKGSLPMLAPVLMHRSLILATNIG